MSNIISVKKDSICIKTFFLFTFLFGIAAHGNMMFNKFSWHDDLQHGFLLSVDKAIGLGRWFRALLGAVMAWL
ncbi:MAG: hypothetical protein IJH60_02775, partial [Eubacterium sp.]|nr:hypothetical protein [Eubacterium sp.]